MIWNGAAACAIDRDGDTAPAQRCNKDGATKAKKEQISTTDGTCSGAEKNNATHGK